MEGGEKYISDQENHFKNGSPIKTCHPTFSYTFFACSDKKKAGVLIAIKNSVQFNLIHLVSDPHGRFLNAKLIMYFALVNSYAPNTRQIAFLNKLWKKLTKVRQGQLWAGDFNGIG